MSAPHADQQAHSSDHIEGYEKIRVVGKGAFGLAVLYRRLSDGELVVIKQVNIIELSASEREFAFNEVQVLSSLDHPNIISYRRSFERDGQLMIEMEYADGGNLSQLLARRREPLSERAALHVYKQICAALKHMHERGVLHRDLKTANVFLTRGFAVKIGDFGISKLLVTRAQAQTILGTPYYISPEMCEGKQYGPKSDIWASGCILYEMVSSRRAFEASNLPALVNKIIKGMFDPIPDNYSGELSKLVQDILQRDPELRPSADELCNKRLPKLLENVENNHKININPQNSTPNSSFMSLDFGVAPLHPKIRSVMYWWLSHGAQFDLEPIPLPATIQVTQVAVGDGHVVLVTADSVVYSWGEGSRGQLGHGVAQTSTNLPTIIESLRGKSVNKVAAGHQFSVFGNESGVLMTCGAGDSGCLGHGDLLDTQRPKIIETLLRVDIVEVACGSKHVAALSAKKDVYTWGTGISGQLGLDDDKIHCSPEAVTLPTSFIKVKKTIRAGPDCTCIITAAGDVIAWGGNAYNKLGLNRSGICGFFKEVPTIWTPTQIQLDFTVKDMSMGDRHSTLIAQSGQVHVFGSDPVSPDKTQHRLITSIGDNVTAIACGLDFTVATTDDNVVYFWGVRHYIPQSNIASHEANITPSFLQSQRITIPEPQEILALYGGVNSDSSVPNLSLGSVLVAGPHDHPGLMYLLLHTTAPVPVGNPSFQPGDQEIRTVQSALTNNANNTVPEWLKAELAAADINV